jgi:hypothetical protein
MSEFIRTEEHIDQMVMDSFGGNVEMDLTVIIRCYNGKLRAYSPKLACNLQFPNKLKISGAIYICDATEAHNNGRVYYRAYKGTIRIPENNKIVG